MWLGGCLSCPPSHKCWFSPSWHCSPWIKTFRVLPVHLIIWSISSPTSCPSPDIHNKEGNLPSLQDSPTNPSHNRGPPAECWLSSLCKARLLMLSFIQAYMVSRPHLHPLFQSCWGIKDTLTMQFIFDCPVIPHIIKKTQESLEPIRKELFYVTRTYVFKIFVTRTRLLEIKWTLWRTTAYLKGRVQPKWLLLSFLRTHGHL